MTIGIFIEKVTTENEMKVDLTIDDLLLCSCFDCAVYSTFV